MRGERRNTGQNAEGAEVTQKSQKEYQIFKKVGNQCLCELQAKSGLKPAWELLVFGLDLVWLAG